MLPKALGRLQPVSLREYWQDEARDYTSWLAREENLGLLSDTLESVMNFHKVWAMVAMNFGSIRIRKARK